MAIRSGHTVMALVRPQSAERIPSGAKLIYGQLPYDIPRESIEKPDVIIHLAAVTTAADAAGAQAVNLYGTEYLLTLARQWDAPFIFTSTQSVISENDSSYARTKRECEALIKESGLDWAILRPGLVYGPGDQGLFARMRKTVQSMPVLPLLGGGKALVQPIHVDDLCWAILQIVTHPEELLNDEYNLGDPNAITLRDFLRQVGRAYAGHSRQVSVPLGPVKAVVVVGQKLRLPFPISMENIRGLETVQRMEVEPSLEKLGLSIRSLDRGLAETAKPVVSASSSQLPVLLIGAGKIGIVHGLQLMKNPAVRLAGIVEPNPKAACMYESMGFKTKFYTSLDDAMKGPDQPLAAIVATPADTHLDVTESCLRARLHVLVEKPLSINESTAAKWHEVRRQYPDYVIHSGYMAAQFPQLLTAYHTARMNKLGKVKAVRLVAFQSHIMASKPQRWETVKERSGGGVMVNFGCHVASMLFRLLGWPDSPAAGWQWSVFSEEVEDSVVAKFSLKSVECTLVASWSVPGFARPYNLVELVCERGILRVENASIYIIQDDEVTQLETQLDYPLAFNMAPDYTGAAFAMEHESFINSIRALNDRNLTLAQNRYMPPVEMVEALRLEDWVRSLYNQLRSLEPTESDLVRSGIPEEIARTLLQAGRVAV